VIHGVVSGAVGESESEALRYVRSREDPRAISPQVVLAKVFPKAAQSSNI
jgi:hypothetical protein